jgi:hypothetical protein
MFTTTPWSVMISTATLLSSPVIDWKLAVEIPAILVPYLNVNFADLAQLIVLKS